MDDSPPPKQKYRWYQFRLRTPLLAMVVVAIGMPIYLDYVDFYKRQHEAGLALSTKGASLTWKPVEPAWLKAVLGLVVEDKILRDCVTVQAERCGLKDEDLASLRYMPNVERLYLSNNPIDDDGLKAIKDLKCLKRLSLWGTKITDDGLRHVARLHSLEILDIHDGNTRRSFGTAAYELSFSSLFRFSGCTAPPLTSDCLKHLTGLKDLKVLHFSFPVDDDALAVLADLPNLRIRTLILDGATDVGMAELPRLHALETVLIEPGRIGGEGLRHLGRTNKLRQLWLDAVQIDEDAWQYFSRMSSLKKLSLRDTPLGDDGLTYLGRLSGLETLLLTSTEVTDDGMANLAGLNSLRILDLRGTALTADCLKYLTGMKQLEILKFQAPMDDDAVCWLAQLSKLKELCGWGNHPNRFYLTDAGLAELPNLPCPRFMTLHDARDGLEHDGIDVPGGAGTMTDDRLACLWEEHGFSFVKISLRDVTLDDFRWGPKLAGRATIRLVSSRSASEVIKGPSGDGVRSLDIHDRGLAIESSDDLGPRRVEIALGNGSCHLGLLQNLPNLKRLFVNARIVRSSPASDWENLRFVSELEEFRTPGYYSSRTLIDAVGIRWLGQMKNLRRMVCDLPDDMSPADLAPLGQLKKLEELELHCKTYDGEALRFVAGLESLCKLRVAGKPRTADDECWLQSLATLPQLAELSLDGVTDAGMHSIGQAKGLTRLSVSSREVTDEGMWHLSDLPSLTDLDARSTGITDQGFEDFKSRRPEIYVRTDRPPRDR